MRVREVLDIKESTFTFELNKTSARKEVRLREMWKEMWQVRHFWYSRKKHQIFPLNFEKNIIFKSGPR